MTLKLPPFISSFFRPELDFRVRLFNLLAMAGIVISLLAAVFSSVLVGGFQMAVINFFSACLSGGLLYYSNSSGQYQRCYLITILVVFFAGFALLFLAGGGYHSGMPSFFIFGIVFTVFMLEGRKMFIVAVFEIIFYSLLCLYAYSVPSQIAWIGTEEEAITDIIFGFVTVSVILGITMHLNFRLYNSQQRQLEQAREEAVQANQAKSLFLAGMSHEIRTPINIMLGMNEMILRARPSAEITGYAARAQDAGRMLLSLINDILDVAKIESGKLELTEEAYLTGDLVQKLVQQGREQSEKKGLSFAAEVSGLPPALCGDSMHLCQIAANFISNAVKYTETGSVRLVLTGREIPDKSGILLAIMVSDTGIGIPPAMLHSIFDAFARSEEARNSKIEGTGLGLAIVRELTDLMGGRLSVESEYGRGSTFTVEIPQRYADETAACEAAAGQGEQSFLAPQAHILVVDDTEGNLSVVQALLARTLLRIDTALSGQECLERVNRNTYHAILLDYMMPQLDGIATLRRLRQMDCQVPVIALTADVTAGTRQKLLDAGFADYLSKPVIWTRLEQALLACLPEELVTRTALSPAVWDGSTAKLGQQLETYDISLEAALALVNGNLPQYKTLARIFLANTRQAPELLMRSAETNDLPELARSAHSLKSLARIAGAGELASLADRLEQKCGAGEAEYAGAALPLFLHELETTRRGLTWFLDAFPAEAAAEAPAETPPNRDALVARARVAIAGYRCGESRQALALLLPLERDAGRRRLLEQAGAAVEELDFEEAELLLQEFAGHKEEASYESET